MEHEKIESAEPKITNKKRRRAQNWRVFGWIVIGCMIVIILLNLFNALEPEMNKILLPSVIIAYVIYVVFRNR